MVKNKCRHSCVFVNDTSKSEKCGLYTINEYIKIIKDIMDCEYNNYINQASAYAMHFIEFNFDLELKDMYYFDNGEFEYLETLKHCPDCGEKLSRRDIMKKINTTLFEHYKKLKPHTIEKEKEIKDKLYSVWFSKREISKKEVNREGSVYLVKLDKHYKIGIATTPSDRLKEFTLLPYELETIITKKVLNNYELEQELHEKYKSKRVRGEWFELNEIEVQEIKNILTEKNKEYMKYKNKEE